MPDAPTTKEFIVTKVRTTTEHFAVTAESVDAAEQAVRGSSGGTLISRNSSENYSVGPRPPEGSAQPVTPGRAQVLRSASGPVVRGGPSNAPGRGPSSLGGLV